MGRGILDFFQQQNLRAELAFEREPQRSSLDRRSSGRRPDHAFGYLPCPFRQSDVGVVRRSSERMHNDERGATVLRDAHDRLPALRMPPARA